MNKIKHIERVNEKELENVMRGGTSSWHDDYRDSAYIYIGGLHFELTEGDILTAFSQFGEIGSIELVRDKKTGKSRGFCFVGYCDQRSTDLAVDNMNGVEFVGRIINVDHKLDYKAPKDKELDNEEEYTASKGPLAPLITDQDIEEEKKAIKEARKLKKNRRKDEERRKLMEIALAQGTTLTIEDIKLYHKQQKKERKQKKKERRERKRLIKEGKLPPEPKKRKEKRKRSESTTEYSDPLRPLTEQDLAALKKQKKEENDQTFVAKVAIPSSKVVPFAPPEKRLFSWNPEWSPPKQNTGDTNWKMKILPEFPPKEEAVTSSAKPGTTSMTKKDDKDSGRSGGRRDDYRDRNDNRDRRDDRDRYDRDRRDDRDRERDNRRDDRRDDRDRERDRRDDRDYHSDRRDDKRSDRRDDRGRYSDRDQREDRDRR